VIFVLALVAFLAIEAPESCKPLVVPLAVTWQTAPLDGVPILFDGAAVTVRCHY
jgi:hypothetical protein